MKTGRITAVILLVSVLMILYGLLLKQNTDVLVKAAKICLECIGIG